MTAAPVRPMRPADAGGARMSGAVRGLVSCPGCGLEEPKSGVAYDRKFHASAECWAVFELVLAAEFQSAILFGRAHQMTADAYAVQHAGGRHPDKSVCIHLAGLCLVLEGGVAPVEVPKALQRIAAVTTDWPHLEPPPRRDGARTVRDVATASDPEAHVAMVRAWASEVWEAWRPHHDVVRSLVSRAA